MKVWVVQECVDCDTLNLLAIFSTEEKAREYIFTSVFDQLIIEEWEVDSND